MENGSKILSAVSLPSPNFDSREGHEIDMLVLHYTGMKSAGAALDRLIDASAKVSAHYVVDEEGKIWQLVAEEMRAWHAGKSYWRGNTNINQRSVGIEIVNPGHEFGYRPFPAAQMKTVVELCRDIVSRHKIPVYNVVAHSDIAPSRKADPGELFDWTILSRECLGESRWAGSAYPSLTELSEYGYDISDEKAVRKAFARRFLTSL